MEKFTEPSSLPLSERLKIFSSLSEATSGISPNCDTVFLQTPSPSITQTTPKSSAPSNRIKFKTVGKLTMPSFLSDNNNNDTSCTPDNKKDKKTRAIGKIKSPFIKNKDIDKKITPRSLNNYNDEDISDTNFDSGKENYDNSTGLGQATEFKKKFSKSVTKVINTQKEQPLIDEKIAKYFGLIKQDTPKTNCEIKITDFCHANNCILLEVEKPTNKLNGEYIMESSDEQKLTTNNSTSSREVQFLEIPKENPSSQTKRRDQAKRNRAKTVIVNTTNTPDKSSTKPTIRTRAMTITNGALYNIRQPKNLITKYEDLKVTKEDLLMASKEFERIFLGAV